MSNDLIETLESIDEFVQRLASVSGRKLKAELFLQAVRTIPEFRDFVLYTYTPFKVYHVRQLPFLPERQSSPITTFQILLEYLDYLNSKGSASSEDYEELARAVSGSPSAHRALSLLLKRSLDCGIGEKTIYEHAREIGLEITVPSVMLCQAEPQRLLGESVLAQPKLDGVRCLTLIKHGEPVLCFSRSFKPLYGALQFLRQARLDGLHNVWLDGELYGSNFQELVRTVRHGDGSTIGKYYVFDVISERFEDLPLRERFDTLQKWETSWGQDRVRVLRGSVLPKLREDEVDQLLEQAVNAGFEGVVLKRLDSTYQRGKRSHDWQKVKLFHTIEAEVVGFEPGTGKFEGMVGALRCKAQIDGREVFFKVGSGMSDQERVEFLTNLPRVIEVSFQELTRDGVPRFPVFKRVRVFRHAEG